MDGRQFHLFCIGDDAVVVQTFRHHIGSIGSRILDPFATYRRMRQSFSQHNLLNDIQ